MKKNVDLDKLRDKTAEYTKLLKYPNKLKLLEFGSKYKKILIPIVLILCLCFGYFLGTPKNNSQQVLNKLQVGLEDGNVRTLNSIIKVNGKKATGNELKPLAKYFQNRSDKVSEFVDLVKNNGTSKIMELKKEKGFLGDNYYIDLKTFDLKVNSNLSNTNITLDGQQIEQGKVVKNLIPGEYTLEGTVDSKYGLIKETGEIAVVDNTNINLDLRGDTVTVKSPYKDATVLINGVSSGKTVEQFKDIGPMPVDGSVSLSIEKQFPWGKVEGPKVQLENNSEVNLTLNMANDALWYEVDSVIQGFYSSVFTALNNESKDSITGASDDAKNKIYSILEKNYVFLKNDYKLDNLTIDKEKSNFTYENGMYKGTVVCDVNYTISKNIFGIIGISNTKENKKFFTNVIYKDGKWIVNNVENFSL